MATIHDVARHADVSIGTVSRVLNNHPSVRPITRRAVLEAIEAIGYHPNAVARNLRHARTGTIGVTVSYLDNPTNMAIVRGIEHAARERGIGLLLCDADGSYATQGAHLRRLCEQRVDAVAIRPAGDFLPQVAPLLRAGVPVVPVGLRQPSGIHPEVLVDEAAASAAALQLLIGLGHRRIGLLLRGFDDVGDDATSANRPRFRDFRRAHHDAGIPVSRELIRVVYREADVFSETARLLALPERPTALVAAVHYIVPDMLLAVRAAGLSIPDDLSFLAYGDSRWAQAVTPALTVIRTDYEEMGRRTAALLLGAMAGAAPEEPPPLRSELVVRASCGPVAANQ